MKFAEKPRVYKIAETQVTAGMEDWLLKEFGSEANKLLWQRAYNPGGTVSDGGATVIEMAARRCYRSFDPSLNTNLTQIRTDQTEYLGNIIKQEHGSTFAHASVTIAFEGVSRVFTHEIVRNSIGNAFSQESLRYVAVHDLKVRLAKVLEPYAMRLGTAMAYLEDVLASVRSKAEAEATPEQLASFSWKKEFTSALRHFMPQISTGIVVTFNMRSLRWFLAQRTAPGVEEEMREVAGMVYELLIKEENYRMILQDAVPATDETVNGPRMRVQFRHPKI